MSTIVTPTKTSYDEFPYDSHPYSQSHPDRLATIATLMGMSPVPLERCRVLELGSAAGGNLFPIAEQYPGCVLTGIDSSSRQVADGQRRLEVLGLKNVRLLHKDILEINEDFGEFDYIICHGVYSWVPAHVQQKILDICARNLSANGVAYVSYNTYPGWRFRGMIRDVMMFRAKFFNTPEQKLNEGQALLDFLANTVPTKENAYGILLRDEVGAIRKHSPSYLFHEHLEAFNEPMYFHQFMDRVIQSGLQYVGEAAFDTMWTNNFPPEVESTLRRLSSDVVEIEQYMDFVRNRAFRQTLLCRAGVRLDRSVPPERVYKLCVASSAEPKEANVKLQTPTLQTFHRPGSSLTTREPIVKAAMYHLREEWPQRVEFDQLLEAARARLDARLKVVNAETVEQEKRELARSLSRCYATTHVDLYASPSPAMIHPDTFPSTTRLARDQAAKGPWITNLWHQSVRAADLERCLIFHLDGMRDRDALARVLDEEVKQRRLVLQEGGREVQGGESVRARLMQILEETLDSLGKKGLLLKKRPV